MKEQCVVTIPVSHEIIYQPKMSALEARTKKYDVLMSQLSCYTYRGTDGVDTILGFGISLVPQYGYFSIVLTFAVSSVLANIGIPIDVELLVSLVPSKDTIQRLVKKM